MYAHIDCNNFFASCERLFRPELEGKPVAVLSNNDGCIISRSQEVKDLGIKMGVPLFQVKPLVKQHDITLFSANFELYGELSERIVLLLREITPLIEVYSIDECFLDLSKLQCTDLTTWAKNVRERVQREVGLPVSVGVGPTKTLAKVATSYAKKHGGVYVVSGDETRLALLRELAVGDIWGVGWRTAPKLKDLGVSTALQLVTASDAWLRQQFNITGIKLIDELRGMSRFNFGDKHELRKSIMVSRSFGHKVRAYHQLESATANFAARAAARLRGQRSVCSVVAVYVSTGRYEERQRRVYKQARLTEATANTGQIIGAALGLLNELYDEDFSYQKTAVTLLDIVSEKDWQLSLTNPDTERDQRAELMSRVDALNKKYGQGTVWHASEDRLHADWHSKHALRSPRYTSRWSELPTVRA